MQGLQGKVAVVTGAGRGTGALGGPDRAVAGNAGDALTGGV